MNLPLLMLHGFTGSPGSWGRVIGELPPEVAAWAEPIIGHNPSLLGGARTTFEDEVDRLASRVRDRVRGPVGVLGYSMGARLALGLAVRHPNLVAQAWLVGIHPGLSTSEERAERARADAEWIRVLDEEGSAAFVKRWEKRDTFDSQRALPERVLCAQRAGRLAHDSRGLALALRALGLGAMPDWRPLLPALRTPLHVVVGAHDAKFRALAEELAALARNARVCVIPDCGHNVVLERPEALATVIKEDLR
jgi:2-succinyl-6-hydroxy-2,4-cyclohexadiene-1-carboxylate synthase